MKQLHIATLNIQGLSAYEYDVQLKEFISQFDMIELCETWGENSSDFSGYFEGCCSFSDVRAKKKKCNKRVWWNNCICYGITSIRKYC